MEVVAFDPVGLADDDAGCIVEAKFLRRALLRPRQAPSDVGLGRELHTVSPARFITTLKRPATTPSARTLAAQIRTSQPTLRSHVCAPTDGCAVISDTPRRLSPFRGIRNRTLRCSRG